MTGPKKRQKPGPERYRGIEYSVANKGEGVCTWKLHPKKEQAAPIMSAPTISGTTKGGHNEAIEAAHRAIDKMLGTVRK
jgi:hypothetical protein